MTKKTPLLSTEQLKRFRKVLVRYRIYPSMLKAIKATDSAQKCRVAFFQLVDFIRYCYSWDDIPDMGIDDIHYLYAADDVPNQTHNKVPDESNCGANLLIESDSIAPVENLTNELNCTHNKVFSLVTENDGIANQTHNKVRGKQKMPVMVHQRIRLPVYMLQRLGELDGTVSGHIRQAIDAYLTQLGENHEHSPSD